MSDTVLDAPAALRLEHAWDVLERFGEALQQCDHATAQIRLLLNCTQESLDADAVVWYPGGGEEGLTSVGKPVLNEGWLQTFRQSIEAGGLAAGELLLHQLDPGARPTTPWPCSAAMVRISKSRGSWLIALSFHPRRLFTPADLRVLRMARRMVLNQRQQSQTFERLRESLFGLVRCLTAAIDAKDPYTWGHSERVARIAVRLARQMNLPAGVQSDLYLGGLLHDIGKIGIRDNVLQKTGPLTEAEYLHIQEHPVIGDRLVSNIKTLQHLRPCIRSHHERFDGRGYPDRLSGEAIPLLGRIMAVADACDAMMAARPYRPALPPERIDAIFRGGAGTHWDPGIVESFMTCRQELYTICQRGLGDSVFAAVERALRNRQPQEDSSAVVAR